MFTKQHYKAVAEVISKLEPITDGEADLIYDLVAGFIVLFKNDNPNFDRIQFIEACYGKDNYNPFSED